MAPTPWAGAALMLVVTVGALVALHKQSKDNGLFDSMDILVDAKNPVIPFSKVPMKTQWTGYPEVDHLIGVFLVFFSPLLDPKNVSLYWQGLHFYGVMSSAWLLVLVEGYRTGNAGLVASHVGIVGVAMELLGVGFITPAWCFLQLLTSPTLRYDGHSKSTLAKNLPDLLDLNILPWAYFIGGVVPGIIMSISKADQAPPYPLAQQYWILIRLFHPLFTVIVHRVIKLSVVAHPQPVKPNNAYYEAVMKRLRTVYTLASLISAATHIPLVASWIISVYRPELLDAKLITALHPRNLWQPAAFWKNPIPKAHDIVHGVHIFLTYDALFTSVSMILWAYIVNRSLLSRVGYGIGGGLALLVKGAFTTLFLGPAAAAVSMIRARDEEAVKLLMTMEKPKKL